MPMTFEEAETRFRQLQARVQRGESISRAEYEEEVGKLAVQDRNGTLWEINPRTGKWMYFDGAEWVSGAPPGHDTSTVMPVPKEIAASAREAQATPSSAPVPSTLPPAPPLTRPVAPPSPPPAFPTASARAPAPPAEPPPFVRTERNPKHSGGTRLPTAPPPNGAPGARPARQGPLGGRNREWVPLAIGAVVLLFCAVVLIIGWNVTSSMFGPKSTPMRATVIAQTTSTKVPTPMLLPSPTPLPPTPVPVVAKVAGDSANVRSKSSTSGTLIVKLKKDQQVTLIAKGPTDGANVWYQINVPDKPGPTWLRSDTIQIVSGDPNTLPASGSVTPTPTKGAAAPAGATATLTPIGVLPPTPKVYP